METASFERAPLRASLLVCYYCLLDASVSVYGWSQENLYLNMDTARQVLRFSIPGSITVMIGLGFLVLGRLLQGDDWSGIQEAVRENVSAVAVIFAAIPLGFFIYQMYYAAYRAFVWPWPWRWNRRNPWVRMDRGAEVLKGLPSEQLAEIETFFGLALAFDDITRKVDTRLGRTAHAYEFTPGYVKKAEAEGRMPYDIYKKLWQDHWNIVRALVEIGADDMTTGSVIRSEYMILSDFYHALGACRIGVLLAESTSIIASVIYVFYGGSWVGSLGMIGVTILVGTAFFFIFHRARGNTWASAQRELSLGLTGLLKRNPGLLGIAEGDQS